MSKRDRLARLRKALEPQAEVTIEAWKHTRDGFYSPLKEDSPYYGQRLASQEFERVKATWPEETVFLEVVYVQKKL